MLNFIKDKFRFLKNLQIFKATVTIIPASLLYYMSTILPGIGFLSLGWQIILPVTVTSIVIISGYDYISNFIAIIKAALMNVWQSIRHKKQFVFPSLDMSALVSLSLLSNIAYGLMLGSAASLVVYTAPLVTLSALNLSNYLKNILNKKLDTKASEKLEKYKEKLPSNTEFYLIKKGDILVVQPGMFIPVDGYLITDVAQIKDGTMLTGEEDKITTFAKNQLVKAGTENIGQTPIEIIAKTEGRQSPVYQLLQSMSKRICKTQTATKIDYISMIFVPVILTISIATFCVWTLANSATFGFKAMMDVLFAVCPCALGFANTIPYSILKKKLFDNNIYIHKDEIIDKFATADTIVFDKTGTLTKISLASIDKFCENEIDYLAILALQKLRVSDNNHKRASDPFANELINIISKQINKDTILPEVKLMNAQSNQSNGIAAEVHLNSEIKTIYMGNLLFLKQNGFNIEQIQNNTNNNETAVYLAVEQNGKKYIEARLNFEQQLREDAVSTIAELKKSYNVLMLTGDNRKNAEIIAEQLGIEKFEADCTPESKEEFIKNLINNNKAKVVMVGDGFNDYLPANAANSGSIAIGKQSIISGFFDLTIENLSDILKLKSTFKSATKTQNQVFCFSIIYNLLAMLSAAILFPMMGMVAMTGCFGVCMAFSSLIATAWSCTLYPKLINIFSGFKSKSHSSDISNNNSDTKTGVKTTELSFFNIKISNQNNNLRRFDLTSSWYPQEAKQYIFSMDVYAMCGNCAKDFDKYMTELQKSLGITDFTITANDTTYTIAFFLHTADVKNALIEFKKKFTKNGKDILKDPSAELIAPKQKEKTADEPAEHTDKRHNPTSCCTI